MCIRFLHCHWGSRNFIQKIGLMLRLIEIKHLVKTTHYSIMDPTHFMLFVLLSFRNIYLYGISIKLLKCVSLPYRVDLYCYILYVWLVKLTEFVFISIADNLYIHVAKVEGPKSPEEMITILQRVVEQYATSLVAARIEAEERLNNQRLREEQDAAYRAALEADQVS